MQTAKLHKTTHPIQSYTLCIWLYTPYKNKNSVQKYTLSTKIHTLYKTTHPVQNYTSRIKIHALYKAIHPAQKYAPCTELYIAVLTLMCLLRLEDWLKHLLHTVHLCGLCFSWTWRMWIRSLSRFSNDLKMTNQRMRLYDVIVWLYEVNPCS